ncbi:MAG: transketolase C-terminal domain-containing protein [Clostridium sp.]
MRNARKKPALIVTAEEHSVIGGLGGAVSEVLAKSGCLVPVEMVGMQDRHGESGPYSELLTKYGLDAEASCGSGKRRQLQENRRPRQADSIGKEQKLWKSP